MEDLPEMAELLARHGAVALGSRPGRARAIPRGVLPARSRVKRGALLLAHPEYLQSPAAMFEAAKRDRPDVLALLLDLGFSLEIQDRTGKRALHEAAASNALRAATFLVERGAEIDPRESSYNGTPIGWAAHGDKTEMVQFLSRYSRDIWTLCFNGYVDRVREILAEDPSRAQRRHQGRLARRSGGCRMTKRRRCRSWSCCWRPAPIRQRRARTAEPRPTGRDAAACATWRPAWRRPRLASRP